MHRFALGLGSNRRHGRHGRPKAILAAALDAVRASGVVVEAVSQTIETLPLGPGGRRYANAAALVTTPLAPPQLLALLQRIERDFGRRRGRRWGARVLDLDILLWSGGRWRERELVIPHPLLAHRRFVLEPLAEIGLGLRRPGSTLTMRHLLARRAARAPVDRHRAGP